LPIFAEIFRDLTRYFIFISFKGTSYHGWQLQPRAVTVQKVVEEALTMILGEKISATGAGRTDSGVHALFFCAHFDTSSTDLVKRKNLVFRLNRILPDDIAVTGIRRVLADASARFSAESRTYRYNISRVKDPFRDELSWYVHGDIDVDAMNRASEILLEHSDFTSFSRLHSDNRTNICKVYEAGWESSDNMLVFTIKADRFLRNMVRAVVGTMLEVGKGKISPDDFNRILLMKNRSEAGMSAPARGLFLTSVEYPDEIFV
jgi:tRNA pseudouridine38-40 synthase